MNEKNEQSKAKDKQNIKQTETIVYSPKTLNLV